MNLCVRPSRPLRGEAAVPGDKSIAHRALILAALAKGESTICGLDPLDDVLRTLAALRACGTEMEWLGKRELRVQGRGLQGLRTPLATIQCGLSGTTMRLLAGLLAGQPLVATLDGDEGLRRRPMARVVEPLRQMGARIEASSSPRSHHSAQARSAPPSVREGPGVRPPLAGATAPLVIHGGGLHGIDYVLPVASAQVKSALLLAGLNATGETVLHEPVPTRDHTERALRWLGQPLDVQDGTLSLRGSQQWQGFDYTLPGDLSGAAFLLAAATLVPGSEVTVRGVGLNPTRAGVIRVLQAMGADLHIDLWSQEPGGEPAGDVTIRSASLRSIELGGALIPNLIDELPILAVVATQAEGRTIVRDAGELRVKESDRIATLTAGLQAMGAAFEPLVDGFTVVGPTKLHGARVEAGGDHRIAMALAVAGLVAEGETVITGAECVSKSFPDFAAVLRCLGSEVL